MDAPAGNLVAAVLVGLAAWRVAFLFVREDGPFDVVYHFRKAIHAFPFDTHPDELTAWEKLWSCMWCLSLWTTLAMAGVWLLEPVIVLVVAVWAIATLIDIHGPEA